MPLDELDFLPSASWNMPAGSVRAQRPLVDAYKLAEQGSVEQQSSNVHLQACLARPCRCLRSCLQCQQVS